MRVLARIKWLLPALLIGLAVVAISLPTWTSDRVLADSPPATDELQAGEADTGPLVVPPLAEVLAGETLADGGEAPDATAHDTSTQGTY